jgi:signal transduction histidine kinase
MALPPRLRHPQIIETLALSSRPRHATTIASALLVVSVGAAVAGVWLDNKGSAAGELLDNPLATVSELLCFGVVGAVLIARRPDLPFGWILGIGAVCDAALVAVGVPALALAKNGHGGQWATWGISLGVLQWVGTALEGIVNVRFPSGRPTGVIGRWLDRLLCFGIPATLLGTYLGDSVEHSLKEDSGIVVPARVVDGSWLTPVGNATVVLIPALILCGILAGIGIVIRWARATGIERQQLQWRASGVVLSLVLFPLAVSGSLNGTFIVLQPLVLVTTLLIPVLRYQLWSGDPMPRRRRLGPIVSRRTLVEAQEEERRRLRRDLHDGLGPLLTGLRLNLDAVQAQFDSDPDKALEHLATARQASAEVISDLRGLVYGLRPPALDELGLAGSLRMHLTALAAAAEATIEVDLQAEDGLEPPAAVEVAIYRAASEAVTNVVRHSKARRCRVAIARNGPDITLEVDDDGAVSETWHPGVGLTSMRERAVELGGDFVASSGPAGFHIRVSYPRRWA